MPDYYCYYYADIERVGRCTKLPEQLGDTKR